MTERKSWFSSVRESWRVNNKEAIRNGFFITEKNGAVFILHNGVAVKEFSNSENIETITRTLEEMRGVAVKFEE